MEQHIALDGAQFFRRANSYLSIEERIRVQEAFALARREHGDQRRQSGELFFFPPFDRRHVSCGTSTGCSSVGGCVTA